MTEEAPAADPRPAASKAVSGPKRPGPIRRLPAWLKGLVVVAVAAAGMFAGLRLAYGGFGSYYYVSVDLPRAGQQMMIGSDVRMSGVVIGKVKQIGLVDRHVRLRLQIDRQYRIPSDASADVDLTTLLGAKFVNIRFAAYTAPFLAEGGRIGSSHVGPELEDALANGVSVFDAIRPSDLATIVSQLAIGAEGHGEDVAKSIQYNADLT
ncbi:MAG TPA: MlaD family protein, partial [Actinomycetota bacterium]